MSRQQTHPGPLTSEQLLFELSDQFYRHLERDGEPVALAFITTALAAVQPPDNRTGGTNMKFQIVPGVGAVMEGTKAFFGVDSEALAQAVKDNREAWEEAVRGGSSAKAGQVSEQAAELVAGIVELKVHRRQQGIKTHDASIAEYERIACKMLGVDQALLSRLLDIAITKREADARR